MFSDLESDFINPIEMCQKLNTFVLPEYLLHAIMTGLFLLNFEIITVFLNIPLIGYHYYMYLNINLLVGTRKISIGTTPQRYSEI
jgi:protein cornichon